MWKAELSQQKSWESWSFLQAGQAKKNAERTEFSSQLDFRVVNSHTYGVSSRIFKFTHDSYFNLFSTVWCINEKVIQNHSFKHQFIGDILTVVATIVIFVWIFFPYKLYKQIYLINTLGAAVWKFWHVWFHFWLLSTY